MLFQYLSQMIIPPQVITYENKVYATPPACRSFLKKLFHCFGWKQGFRGGAVNIPDTGATYCRFNVPLTYMKQLPNFASQ